MYTTKDHPEAVFESKEEAQLYIDMGRCTCKDINGRQMDPHVCHEVTDVVV